MAALRAAACAALVVAISLGLISQTPELALFRSGDAVPFFGWPVPRADFTPVAHTPGLFKLDLPWYFTPWHRETLDVYALQLGGGAWAVSDAGGYDTWLHAHATHFERALRALMAATDGGALSHVLLTHGHLDHIGALPRLVAAWPGLRVVMHEAEAPFLLHPPQRTHSPPWWSAGSAGLRLAHAAGMLPRRAHSLTPGREVLLRGAGGSLAAHDAGAADGLAAVTWAHLPGHAPSHVVYMLNGTVLGGDVADVLRDTPGVSVLPDGRATAPGRVALYTLAVMADADADVAAASLCRLAFDEAALPWTRILPYHDATKQGFTRAEWQRLAEEAVGCSKRATASAG